MTATSHLPSARVGRLLRVFLAAPCRVHGDAAAGVSRSVFLAAEAVRYSAPRPRASSAIRASPTIIPAREAVPLRDRHLRAPNGTRGLRDSHRPRRTSRRPIRTSSPWHPAAACELSYWHVVPFVRDRPVRRGRVPHRRSAASSGRHGRTSTSRRRATASTSTRCAAARSSPYADRTRPVVECARLRASRCRRRCRADSPGPGRPRRRRSATVNRYTSPTASAASR